MVAEQLRDGERVQFVARGSSMWPLVASGSRVEVEPCPPSLVRPGDLVAFEGDRGVVIHRLIERKGDLLVCQGDARASPDPPVVPAKVLGRARVIDRPRGPLRWPAPRSWPRLARRLARAGKALVRVARVRARTGFSRPRSPR